MQFARLRVKLHAWELRFGAWVANSEPSQQLPFFGEEFVFGEDAALTELAELIEQAGDFRGCGILPVRHRLEGPCVRGEIAGVA
jgi:hypothetical protein